MTTDELRQALLADRRASFIRLRGGFPIPVAGAVYWFVLAYAGTQTDLRGWVSVAVWGSGLIFPLALLFAKLFRCDFMHDRTAAGDVLLPALVAMLLFWPMLAATVWTAPQLAPLILAIGMSLHWPVIGWSYGQTGIYTAHAVARAVVAFAIWQYLPNMRLTGLPLSVALIYLATVAAIIVRARQMSAWPVPTALA